MDELFDSFDKQIKKLNIKDDMSYKIYDKKRERKAMKKQCDNCGKSPAYKVTNIDTSYYVYGNIKKALKYRSFYLCKDCEHRFAKKYTSEW